MFSISQHILASVKSVICFPLWFYHLCADTRNILLFLPICELYMNDLIYVSFHVLFSWVFGRFMRLSHGLHGAVMSLVSLLCLGHGWLYHVVSILLGRVCFRFGSVAVFRKCPCRRTLCTRVQVALGYVPESGIAEPEIHLSWVTQLHRFFQLLH